MFQSRVNDRVGPVLRWMIGVVLSAGIATTVATSWVADGSDPPTVVVVEATTTTVPPSPTTTVLPVTTTTVEAQTVRQAAAAPVTVATRPAPTSTVEHLARIKQCESRGNYAAVSASGKYRGAYQFSRATWDGNAARAGRPDLVGQDPAAVAPGDQDAMAVALYEASGPGQWPVCQHR